MNINQQWHNGEVPPLSHSAMMDLLERRILTFAGFCRLESKKGFLSYPSSLSTPAGQEMARILLFRVIEETMESCASEDDKHRKEEIIDAMNYLMSVAILDPKAIKLENLAELLTSVAKSVYLKTNYLNLEISTRSLFSICEALAGDLPDTFRNRAWMENAQAPCFEGSEIFKQTITTVSRIFFECFASWEEFYRFFVSKDNVLAFRLKTLY